MTTESQLQQVFANNFVAYFRAHVAHVNTQGRNFYSDHKLLGKIYADLQSQTDSIAELLRTVQEFMPTTLAEIMESSQITDMPCEGSADSLLEDVRADLEQLKGDHEELMMVAEEDGHKEIANYAQDRILQLAKYIWMLDSTLD
jgi:DNA-binding ferritin-like protein